jgi:hypothetical protein
MRTCMASLAVLFVVAFSCIAQQMPVITVDVPFPFIAGTNSVPAGTYELQPNGEGTHIQLHNMKTNESYIVSVFTSIAIRESNQPMIAFDVEGENHYLSEVHIPGIDGYAFEGAKGKHTHMIIQAK